MARKRFKPEAERIPEAAGLQVTQPEVSEPIVNDDVDEAVSDVNEQVDNDPQEILSEPVEDSSTDSVEPESPIIVSSTIPTDPNATIAACLLAVGRLYNEVSEVSAAISGHLPRIAAEVELHAFLMRVQTSCGEFRHQIDQIEATISDRLREAI